MGYYKRLRDEMGLVFVSAAQDGNVKMSSFDGQSFVYVPDPMGMFDSAIDMAYAVLKTTGAMVAY